MLCQKGLPLGHRSLVQQCAHAGRPGMQLCFPVGQHRGGAHYEEGAADAPGLHKERQH